MNLHFTIDQRFIYSLIKTKDYLGIDAYCCIEICILVYFFNKYFYWMDF